MESFWSVLITIIITIPPGKNFRGIKKALSARYTN